MEPSNSNLRQCLVNMLSASPVARARAENIIFEERVGTDRQVLYEKLSIPAGSTYQDLLESHGRFIKFAIYTEAPETFQAINGLAALAALRSDTAAEQYLLRIECLDFALTHSIIGSVDLLASAIDIYQGIRSDPDMNRGEAKALLEKVCESLNSNPYAVRPRFATFAQDMEADVEALDWAERLRDRLGLPHYPSTKRFGPHPVALMRYKVGDVTARADKLGLPHAVTVPTALDSELYEVFHPAPREENYGRTLNLAGDAECCQLASEVLHPRIDYRPEHFLKVGVISKTVDLSGERLAELREGHRFCLQYLSGREDFGKI